MSNVPQLTRRRAVALAIAPALLATAIAAAAPHDLAGQDWRTVTTMRRAAGEQALRVDVEYGVGELRIEPGTGDLLYRAKLRYDAEIFRPQTQYSDGRLRLGIAGQKGVKLRGHRSGQLDIALGANVPLDLQLKFGAVEANLELGGLKVSELRVATGASETTIRFSKPNETRLRRLQVDVGAAAFRLYGLANARAEELNVQAGVAEVLLDFTGEWIGDLDAAVKMGLGSVTLRIPRDVGVRITKSSMLASFDWDGFTKRGNQYFSENFDSARYKLLLNVDSAFGSIDVDWAEPTTAITTVR